MPFLKFKSFLLLLLKKKKMLKYVKAVDWTNNKQMQYKQIILQVKCLGVFTNYI